MHLSNLNHNHHQAQSNGAEKRGRIVRGTMSGVVILCCCLVLVSCKTPEERYRVLLFFFDGVPLPPSMQPVVPLAEMTDDSDPSAMGKTKQREKEAVTYYHTPYTNKSGCYTSCHDRNKGFGAVMTMTGAEMCSSCHPSYFRPVAGDWAHAPVMLGDCKNCHEPHKSDHEGLLTKDQRELCFECHDSAILETDPYHARLDDDMKCSVCHDPHGAGNRLLLVDSRSYGRRKKDLRKVVSNHDYKPPDECGMCHNLQQSNIRYENLEKQCLVCHDKVLEVGADVKMHQAVTDIQCLVCHTPHKTSRPNLIRANAQFICYACHEKPHETNRNHPGVDRVDCLVCHYGHHGEREYLLKPGVWLPGGENPLPTEEELQQDQQAPPLEKAQDDKPTAVGDSAGEGAAL